MRVGPADHMLTTCRAIPLVVRARRATACQPSRRIRASAALMRSAAAIQDRVSLGSRVLLHHLCCCESSLREAAKSEETGLRDARALYPSIHALGSGKAT